MSDSITKEVLKECVSRLNIAFLHSKHLTSRKSIKALAELGYKDFYYLQFAYGGCQLVNKKGETLSGFESKREIWQRVNAMRHCLTSVCDK